MPDAGDQPLVIRPEDLDEDPAPPPRVVVDFTEETALDPELTVAPGSIAGLDGGSSAAAPEEPLADAVGVPDVDLDSTVETGGSALPPLPPVAPPMPEPAPPSISLPKLSAPPPPLVIESDEPSHLPPPTPSDGPGVEQPGVPVANLLAVESALFTGATIMDDLPAVEAFVRNEGRPPLTALVDDHGSVLSHPLADVRDVAVSPDGQRVAIVSCWSQTLFGLDPIADYVLDADPGLAVIDGGPYDRFVTPAPQVSIHAIHDGRLAASPAALLTAAPLGVDAPAWSPDGRHVAVLEWRGPQPKVGASWVVHEVDVETGTDTVLAAVPARTAPGAFARLAYSPGGGQLLLSGASTGILLDRVDRTWIELPLACAAWSPQRGPGWLIGTDRDADDDGAERVRIGWFDLAAWTAEPLGVVQRPDVCAGGFLQLDLSADGRFLAGVTRLRADDGALPPLNAHRVGVIDLEDLTLDLVTASNFDGVPNTVREQRSPRWLSPGAPGDDGVLAEGAGRLDASSPGRDELDAELGVELEELSAGYHLAATHPNHPGACAAEAERFTRRAIEVVGRRPWLVARLEGLPPERLADPTEVLGAHELDRALAIGSKRAAAACALADDADDDADEAWRAALRIDDGDQATLLQIHRVDRRSVDDGSAEALARAAAGPDPRLAAEARLRHAVLHLGTDPSALTNLDLVATGTDPWLAARAQAVVAQEHLRQGRLDDARPLILGALAGPDEDAARAAASLVGGTALADEPAVRAHILALDDPDAA
jgi:hypothetical protein